MTKQAIYFDDNDTVVEFPISVTRRVRLAEKIKLNGADYEIFKIEEYPGGIRYTATKVLKESENG